MRQTRQQEYMLNRGRWRFGKKNSWRKMSTCMACKVSMPVWRGPLDDRVCKSCVKRYENRKYE